MLSPSLTTLIPLPPPPNAALMITGYPYFSTNDTASSTLPTGPGVPGTTGTLHLIARVRAETLSPSPSMTSGVGPMNLKYYIRAWTPAIWATITYDHTGLLDLASKLGVLRKETITGMDHVHSMGNSNLNNLIDRQICLHGGVLSPRTNSISFIRLWNSGKRPD